VTRVPPLELQGDELYLALCEQGVLVALVQEPARFSFEIRTLDPAIFEWRAHREIAAAIRRLADRGRLPHYLRVRRQIRAEDTVTLLDELKHVGAAYGNIAGLIGEIQRLRRARRARLVSRGCADHAEVCPTRKEMP
jgi:hypothetical protein